LKKKILLLSGYDAASHKYWRGLLAQHLNDFDWTQLALPDRHFYWRVRGNSMGFAFNHTDVLSQNYDLLIVTSMVDLSSLRGFCPSLANIPTIVYFHENQFAYPVSDAKQNLINVQLTSIYSALCADKVIFNSEYNKTTFLVGCSALLKRLPDEVPSGLSEQIETKSEVLAVPIHSDVTAYASNTKLDNAIPHILWNHRWEYDKQPEVFFNALSKLKKTGFEFKLHILGQSFRNQPDCFEQAKLEFEDEIINYGYQTREQYLKIVAGSDIVISSTLHDFQGLSLQEAISLDCIPIAPDRVAYPEYIPKQYLYAVSDDIDVESENLFVKLKDVINSKGFIAPNLEQYSTKQLIPKYLKSFKQLLQPNK